MGLREAFVARPGCVLVSADYSQIEMRLMAHFSRDAPLIAALQAYARTATRTVTRTVRRTVRRTVAL